MSGRKMRPDDSGLDALHADLCKVFTSPTRIQLLRLLRGGERTVGALVEQSGTTQPNVSRHLAVMRGRGIVLARKDGTNVYYALTDPKTGRAFDLMRQVLEANLARGGSLARAGRRRPRARRSSP